jgi:nucleoside-diphosphate-sugar epimerase
MTAKGDCLILGGTGYIGHNWGDRLSALGLFDRIILADLRPPSHALARHQEFVQTDVRQPLAFPGLKPEWIFNFAAVHREPGHAREEYFDTNLAGAKHACALAEATGCANILFTSSIAVYGTLSGPTAESCPTYPTTPYGISKLCAEFIHKGWQQAHAGRRLHICRPGVIYGPGDPGNILRMIRAVRKGYFVFPGSKQLRKSYGYIEGLLDSFEFVMNRPEKHLLYNYVERETEPLGELVGIVQKHLGRKTPTLTAPKILLESAAALAQVATGGKSAIHPVRVRKMASSTHVLPEALKEMGFKFRFDFASSLRDWAGKTPADFQ